LHALLRSIPRRRSDDGPPGVFAAAPQPYGVGRIAAPAFALLAVTFLAVVPAVTVETFATSLCTVFLAAAALRLFSVAFSDPASGPAIRNGDDKLPIYIVICALYREASVVNDLGAAIRAIDYPGIMAQTPQA
jgi:hypothetical protein